MSQSPECATMCNFNHNQAGAYLSTPLSPVNVVEVVHPYQQAHASSAAITGFVSRTTTNFVLQLPLNHFQQPHSLLLQLLQPTLQQLPQPIIQQLPPPPLTSRHSLLCSCCSPFSNNCHTPTAARSSAAFIAPCAVRSPAATTATNSSVSG